MNKNKGRDTLQSFQFMSWMVTLESTISNGLNSGISKEDIVKIIGLTRQEIDKIFT